mgnify:FL=1
MKVVAGMAAVVRAEEVKEVVVRVEVGKVEVATGAEVTEVAGMVVDAMAEVMQEAERKAAGVMAGVEMAAEAGG